METVFNIFMGMEWLLGLISGKENSCKVNKERIPYQP